MTKNTSANDPLFFEYSLLEHDEMTLTDAVGITKWEKNILDDLDEKLALNNQNGIVEILDELYDDPDARFLFLLGAGGLICVLSSLNCRALDVGHSEEDFFTYPSKDPWVAFHAPLDLIELLSNLAEVCDVNFHIDPAGLCQFSTVDVRSLNLLATMLINNFMP